MQRVPTNARMHSCHTCESNRSSNPEIKQTSQRRSAGMGSSTRTAREEKIVALSLAVRVPDALAFSRLSCLRCVVWPENLLHD